MKKILFALIAAVAMGFTASASAVDWSFTTKNTSTAAAGGTIYLVLGTAESYDTIEALQAVAVASATLPSSGTKYSTGAQTWTGGTGAVGSKDTFSMVLVDSAATGYNVVATGLTGTYYDNTDPLAIPPTAMGKTVTTAITSVTSFSGGDVPEPTSGLLLLVGGAMLALRRKQK